MPHRDPTIPSDQDAALISAASRALEQHYTTGESLHLLLDNAAGDVAKLELPPAVAQLLLQLLKELGNGRAVSIVSTKTEITEQQAADLLNVSQSYLLGMIENGDLPAHRGGDQLRLQLADVIAYRTVNRVRRLEALREMTEIDQELGLR